MRSFRFKLGTPGANEVPIALVRLYESPDGLVSWALSAVIEIASLVDVGAGVKQWDCETANPSAYARLVPVSSAGVERADGVVIPPAPVAPGVFTVYCWTKDIGLGVVSGVRMEAAPSGRTYAKVGSGLAVKPTAKTSDGNGYVAINLPADAGTISITIDRSTVTVDSTGKTGQALNVADLLS